MIATIKGARWFYSDNGQGDTVLFLHGGLEDSGYYTRLVTELSASFRVVAVDRRGHGKSEDTDAPYDYPLMAEEVYAFTRELGLGRFHILGYSDGANIGFHMAADHPKSVKSLVAVSGNYKGLSGMTEAWLSKLPLLSESFAREHMAKVVARYMDVSPCPDFPAYMAKTAAIWREDVVVSAEKLTTIQAKTLLVCGDRDIVLPEQCLEMRALIPNASLMMLPDTGHTIFQDYAYKIPAAATIVKDFLLKNA